MAGKQEICEEYGENQWMYPHDPLTKLEKIDGIARSEAQDLL